MYLRAGLILLAVLAALVVGRPSKDHRQTKDRDLKKDVIMRSKKSSHPVGQGECPEGWVDGRSVGLGCVLADRDDASIDEPTAETVCKNFGEGGRLIEVFSQEQMSFLQNYLATVEEEMQVEDGWIWWWIGLNDRETEGEFVWPVNGPANYTYWDVELDEPYPGIDDPLVLYSLIRDISDPDHQYNCVEMQSSMFNLLWQTYDCDDGGYLYAVCQLP